MDRTIRPLVIIAAFAASLVVGLVIMLWAMGGLRTVHLAALDDRIKAAVAVGWMASFPAQLESKIRNTIGHTKVISYREARSLRITAPLPSFFRSHSSTSQPPPCSAPRLHGI